MKKETLLVLIVLILMVVMMLSILVFSILETGKTIDFCESNKGEYKMEECYIRNSNGIMEAYDIIKFDGGYELVK